MLPWTKAATLGLAVLAGSGCATPGTRPHDMSVAGHEKAATVAEAEAAEHSARASEPPSPSKASSTASSPTFCRIGPCWREEPRVVNDHVASAEQLRVVAAQHRHAAASLRTAEERACTELSEADRDLSPFFHRADVVRVEPMYRVPGTRDRTLIGAKVVFGQVPGLTAAWMQKSLDCHLARNAAMGFDAAEMSYCPLAPKGVHAVAREEDGRVAVEVTADDTRTAQEILRRSQLVAAAGQ